MEPFATSVTDHQRIETWEAYSFVSPTKFIILCVFSFGLYGLWWQYKTWRFFKQWQQTDILPVWRTIFSLFNINALFKTINQFAYSTGDYTPMPNPTGLATGYIILNLFARLPDPVWIVALGASGFLVPPYRAFRDAMLQAPAYGGRDQPHFSTRQVLALSLGLVFWSLVLVGLTVPD